MDENDRKCEIGGRAGQAASMYVEDYPYPGDLANLFSASFHQRTRISARFQSYLCSRKVVGPLDSIGQAQMVTALRIAFQAF